MSRFPKLSELLGKGKLGALMQRLFQRPNMQLGAGVKRGEQDVGPGGLLQRVVGGSTVPPTKTRPNTATPSATSVLKDLAKQRQAESVVKSFTTSQGSQYSVAGQSTTRTKSKHDFHDPKDIGLKEASQVTYYVTQKESQRLGMHGSLAGKKTIIVRDGKIYPAAWNEKQKKWGLAESDKASPIALQSAPRVGLSPIELWEGKESEHIPGAKEFGKWHAGNEITGIEYERRESSERPNIGAVSSAKSFVTNIVQAIGGRGQSSSGSRSTLPTTATPSGREAMRAASTQATQRAKSERAKQSANSKRLDKLQRLGDLAGIVDPSGIVDGINAVVSLKRAHDEPERRGEHIRNAIVSGISAIPLIGDLAKLTKVGKAEKGASAAAKGRHATSATASTSKPTGKSFVSQVLGSVNKWGPIAMEGAQAVFSKADRSSAAASVKPTTKAGSSVQQPSILGRLAKSAMGGIASIFGGGRESHQQSSATGAAPPPPTSPAGAPWWSKKDDQASAPIGTPAPGFYGQSQPVWKRAMYGWWQSKFGGGAKQETGRSRRPRSSDQPNVPESPSPIEAPSQPAPRTFGERVRSAVSGVGAAVSAGFGYRNEQPRSSSSTADTLAQGSNFGDVMGGKKKLDDVEKEVEGNRQLSESKERFAEAVKNATGRLGALAVGAIVLTKGLERLNAASIARQASLIEVSPGHSFAAGRAEIARINRDILSGSGTSGSFARRVEAQSGFENAMRPGRDMMTNIANNAMAKFTTWFTTLIEIGTYWAGFAGHAAETGVKGVGFGTGGLIGGSLGATVGKAIADATIGGAKSLADGKQANQPESWQHLFDDLASGKITGPKSPRKL